MPQIFPLRELCFPDSSWMIWEITENEAYFNQIPDSWKITLPSNHALELKRLESLAARFCLWQLVKNPIGHELVLVKSSNNRPFFQDSDWKLSISHSYPYVAAAISKQKNIGIDLEKKTRNIQKVAPRFLSTTELEWSEMDSKKLLAAWTVKEAIYKAQHQAGLDFRKEISFDCQFPLQKGHVQVDQKSTDFDLWHEEFPQFGISLAIRN